MALKFTGRRDTPKNRRRTFQTRREVRFFFCFLNFHVYHRFLKKKYIRGNKRPFPTPTSSSTRAPLCRLVRIPKEREKTKKKEAHIKLCTILGI